MTITARLRQHCMAYCGHEIIPGMRIEEGPNGWQHADCRRVGTVNRPSPPIDRPNRTASRPPGRPAPRPFVRPSGLTDVEAELLYRIHDKYRVNQPR